MTIPVPRHRHLILGGVKSGKSGHAEQLADAYSRNGANRIILIATATAEDSEMHRRIERHKKERNKSWRVIEEPIALSATLSQAEKTLSDSDEQLCIVIDCLTLWVTNLLMRSDNRRVRQEIDQFLQFVAISRSRLIMVSNETNMGVTPMGELSRRFCDEVGLLHQALGNTCDQVTLMVAGIPLNVKKITD